MAHGAIARSSQSLMDFSPAFQLLIDKLSEYHASRAATEGALEDGFGAVGAMRARL